MRAMTLIFLILVMMIAFGFILSESIQRLETTIDEMTADKRKLEDDIAGLNTQIALLNAKQDLLNIFNENPVILTGALLTQLAAAAMKFNKKLGFQRPAMGARTIDERYVKLSSEEVRQVIASRRDRTIK